MQGLPLGQTSADEQGQTPQGLSLRSSPPGSWATFKSDLELTLKLLLKEGVMLGGSQDAVDHGNQGDMALNGAEVAQLILIQPFGLAFLVIDFNGPAVAANAGDACGVPVQAVADEKGGVVR